MNDEPTELTPVDVTATPAGIEYIPTSSYVPVSAYLYYEDWDKNKYIDILNNIMSCVLYEDLFSILKATIDLVDINNMPDALPIVGGERVEITFIAPGDNIPPFNLKMVVYKISSKEFDHAENRHIQYTLHLCSEERYRDMNTSLRQSFQGTYVDIIKKIYKTLNPTKSLVIDTNSFDLQSFISPGWTPLQCCFEIANRTLDITNQNPVLFYETRNSFELLTFSNLHREFPYTTFYIEPGKQIGIFATPKLYRHVLEVNYHESCDKTMNMLEGVYGGDYYFYDTKFNTLEKKKYNYYEEFYKSNFPKLESNPIPATSDKTQFNRSFLVNVKSDNSHIAQFKRKVFLGLLDTYKITIKVPGDPLLMPGLIVNLDVPSKSTISDKEQLTSGKWIITAVKHTFTKTFYSSTLELCKDSVATAPINISSYPKNGNN